MLDPAQSHAHHGLLALAICQTPKEWVHVQILLGKLFLGQRPHLLPVPWIHMQALLYLNTLLLFYPGELDIMVEDRWPVLFTPDLTPGPFLYPVYVLLHPRPSVCSPTLEQDHVFSHARDRMSLEP